MLRLRVEHVNRLQLQFTVKLVCLGAQKLLNLLLASLLLHRYHQLSYVLSQTLLHVFRVSEGLGRGLAIQLRTDWLGALQLVCSFAHCCHNVALYVLHKEVEPCLDLLLARIQLSDRFIVLVLSLCDPRFGCVLLFQHLVHFVDLVFAGLQAEKLVVPLNRLQALRVLCAKPRKRRLEPAQSRLHALL